MPHFFCLNPWFLLPRSMFLLVKSIVAGFCQAPSLDPWPNELLLWYPCGNPEAGEESTSETLESNGKLCGNKPWKQMFFLTCKTRSWSWLLIIKGSWEAIFRVTEDFYCVTLGSVDLETSGDYGKW